MTDRAIPCFLRCISFFGIHSNIPFEKYDYFAFGGSNDAMPNGAVPFGIRFRLHHYFLSAHDDYCSADEQQYEPQRHMAVVARGRQGQFFNDGVVKCDLVRAALVAEILAAALAIPILDIAFVLGRCFFCGNMYQ